MIGSGHSFGAFDRHYTYRTKEAEAAGGAVLWDLSTPQSDSAALLAGIDSPLCSVALAYDASVPMDMARMAPFFAPHCPSSPSSSSG